MERQVGWYVIKTNDSLIESGIEVAYYDGRYWNLAGTEYERGQIEVVSGKLDLTALMNKD